MSENNSLENLYEVVKTVRFGLQSVDSSIKNQSYQDIADSLKKNTEIIQKVNKYKKRITEASDKNSWEISKSRLQKKVIYVQNLTKSIKQTLKDLDTLKEDSKNNFAINFKVSLIKKSCGFGKNLFWDIQDKTKTINLSNFTKLLEIENVKKYSEGKYKDCANKFIAYTDYIEDVITFILKRTDQIKNLLDTKNHEKARLVEIYLGFQNILKNLEIVDKIFHQAITFGGGLKEEVEKLRNKIVENKELIEILLKETGNLLEEIHDPKHGYEVGKATIHYRTINKRFIPNDKIEDIEKLLGKDSIKADKFYNPLAKFSLKILEKIKGKTMDGRLNIEKSATIVEKAKKLIECIKEIDRINEEDINLWNICNCLNNKKQTYNEFMNQEIDFESLGYKQKLKFGLTILVDCDVYKQKDFIVRCKTLKSQVIEYLKTINFTEYSEYKNFTQEIAKYKNPKDNAKERGKLISKTAKERGKLISKTLKERDYELVNKEISQIRGALDNYLKFLRDNGNELNAIQYFAVLAKNKDDKNIVLLIQNNKSEEETMKNFYQKINSNKLKCGNEKFYLYNSITEKAIKKLFNQPKSEEHPFKNFKARLLATHELKDFDELKFDKLSLEELKELLKEDISKTEKWEEKFTKFYKNIASFKSKKELLQHLTKNAFIFEEKSFDLESLKKELPDLIIAKLAINTNQKKQSIHKNYFEVAFEKMLNHEDVDVKINPEFQIYYTPEEDEDIKFEKIKDVLKRKIKYNKKEIKTEGQAKDLCEKEHRFWRDSVTLGVSIEIESKNPNEKKTGTTRIIGIDRGEKKIATLCHLEKSDKGEFILPIEYFEKNGDEWKEKKSYFLDLAQFKIGRVNKKQEIIKWQEKDKNIELKKYEFIKRFITTIWIKDNREKIQEVWGHFENEKINNFEYVRKFINDLTHTEKEKKDGKVEGKIFNNDKIGNYQKEILKDTFVLSKLAEIIIKFKSFNFNTEEKDVLKQQCLELQKVRFRDTLASNIAGIVNFLFKQNNEQKIKTFCALENLHNSKYINFVSEDKISGQILINEDFVESTHNKLYQTSIYGKVEQAIMNKLQVYNHNYQRYLNYSFDKKRKNQTQEIQFELKEHSKRERCVKENFKNETLKIQETKFYGSIAFVDPLYTSRRCPNCNETGKKVHRKNLKSYEDKIECKICKYESKLDVEIKDKVKLEGIHDIISSGDENGAFFIGYRCLQDDLFKN